MIYENVRALANKRGLSLTEVEKQAGLSRGIICKWKTASPTADKLQAVAKILKCSVDDLLSTK